uniref:TELO2 interacting protein 2 n=1 Tax=Anas platyrhynchos platyrhynchos TaxID=8840 RepID=U3I4Z1_ANAPP|nr:TELO2-interacting protein 2 isoform X1 [Anas platyrhynchos]|eukprot:XP_012959745.2 TELO2-interacting protein 2 isoform X1 [Anas platyrhynchos]
MELAGFVQPPQVPGERPPPAPPPAERALPQPRPLTPEGPGALSELGALLEASGSRRLFGDVSPGTLGELVASLSRFAAPPEQQQEAAELPAKDSAYEAVAERAVEVGAVLLRLLAKLEAARTEETPGEPVVGVILRRVAAPIYIFAVTHVVDQPWTNARSRVVARELLESLVQAAGCGSVAEFLRGKKEDEEGRFAAVMGLLKQELTKDTWKRNPATKHVFSWTLPHVTRPWLSHYLESVLPPSLLISDDYREENKILGVRCLHHLVLNVPGADLCQYNRAQVVYHALYNHLYSREAPLLQAVLLCLLDLLPVLERAQHRQQQHPRAPSHSDEVLQLLLTHMEAEHRLALRRLYARSLPAFVQRLGILVVRHLKRLQRVIVGYLEVCDGPEEEARLGILQTLRCTIEHAWPRMPCRLPELLQALLRMMWDVHTDQGPTPEPVKAALLQGATECLILLDRCSVGQVKILLEGVYSSCEESCVRDCLRKVRENT